jgi:hypothetical protein
VTCVARAEGWAEEGEFDRYVDNKSGCEECGNGVFRLSSVETESLATDDEPWLGPVRAGWSGQHYFHIFTAMFYGKKPANFSRGGRLLVIILFINVVSKSRSTVNTTCIKTERHSILRTQPQIFYCS